MVFLQCQCKLPVTIRYLDLDLVDLPVDLDLASSIIAFSILKWNTII